MRPVQQGLGGGRYAVRCRHGHKGGRRRGSGTGDHGRWRLRQRDDHGGCLSLRDAEPLGQGGQGAGRGIAEGAQRGQENMDPLMRFALDHPEQAPVHHLEGVGLEGGEKKQEPIFWRRQGAVFVHGKLAGGPGLPIEAPRRPMRSERGLKGWDQGLKLLEGHTGDIQELRGAGLQIGEPYTGGRRYRLSLEAPYTINRDKLNCYSFAVHASGMVSDHDTLP